MRISVKTDNNWTKIRISLEIGEEMFGSSKLKTISKIPIIPMKPNTYIEMENEKQDDQFATIDGKKRPKTTLRVICFVFGDTLGQIFSMTDKCPMINDRLFVIL